MDTRPMKSVQAQQTSESGQAAVEAALVLPLTVFLILGTLQLFMMLQGRLMAEHAAYRAVRVGSVNHGACEPMTHAAIAALLPSFVTFLGPNTPGGTAAEQFATAFSLRKDNAYRPGSQGDGVHNRSIVWLVREQPLRAAVNATWNGFRAEDNFDDPSFQDTRRPPDAGGFRTPGYRLELRLVYWFPLRIPFANWVMATMFRAHFGLQEFHRANPLLLVERDANWTEAPGTDFARQAALESAIRSEFRTRYNARQYAFPIQASSAMRMFTPPRPALFGRQNCAPAPEYTVR